MTIAAFCLFFGGSAFGVLVGGLLASAGRTAAYDDGYQDGFLDGCGGRGYLFSTDTDRPARAYAQEAPRG